MPKRKLGQHRMNNILPPPVTERLARGQTFGPASPVRKPVDEWRAAGGDALCPLHDWLTMTPAQRSDLTAHDEP